jgi:GDPmannose 4,6-dehydratase
VNIERDWGWAPEYVDAMWRMLQQPAARDYVIATGEPNKLSDFVESAFREVGLDWKDHVELDPTFLRPTDISRGFGDPSRAASELGWKAQYHMKDVVRMMVEGERILAAGGTL